MKVIPRKWAVGGLVLAVALTTGGVAYAASAPSQSDAQQALDTLQAYVSAQPTSTVTVTAPAVTTTVTAPPVTSTVTQTVTQTVTVTGSPSPSTTSPTPTPTTTSPTPTPTTTSPTPTTTSPSPSGPSFTPTTSWAWADGPSLGCTPTGDQWASATVAGLGTTDDFNAGFRLRFTSTATSLYAGVSGNRWKVESPAIGQATGTITAPANGSTVRVALTGTTLTIAVNGTTVATRSVTEALAGRSIVPSVWQSAPNVKMTNIQSNAGACTTPTPTPTPTTTSPTPTPTTTSPSPSTTPPVSGVSWLSGASSGYATDGSYAAWRGEPVKVVGTWSDSQDGALTAGSLDNSDMDGLNASQSLDIAIGAIWNGQTWSAAAGGSYDGQWTTILNAVKTKAAAHHILPQNTYIRFAHEMNGDWTDWKVPSGQEANFRAAITRFSNLRYQVFGTTNPAKVVLCANDGTSGGMADPRNLFVGKDSLNRQVTDVYCIDTYNAWPHRTSATDIWNSMNAVDGGVPDSIEEHRQFAESKGVPFSIGEWSNCGIDPSAGSECAGSGGGEAPAYVQQMNRYFRAHAGDPAHPAAGQLLYEVQFNLWNQFAFYGSEAHQPQTSAAYAALVWGQ